MGSNPEIQDAAIDKEQRRLDKLDQKEDKFVRNYYLTDLFIRRVDAVQVALDSNDLDSKFEEDVRQQLWTFLASKSSRYWEYPDERRFDAVLDNVEAALLGNGVGSEKAKLELPEKKKIAEWRKMATARLRAQLEKDLKDKNKVINEHYLEILKWPEDEKIIREIFERLVTYRYDTNKGGRYRDSKQLEAQPRVFLSDFHPFQLVYMAKAIGVPDDFQFTVYEDRPKQGYERLYRGKKYKSMTLGELIKYEKSRLLTDVVLDDDKKHEDDEWLLLLLNLEGVSDPSTVVGTNLDGKPIRKSDVVDSVKSELMISTKFGPQILNWDRRLFGTLYFHAEGNISVLQKTVRTIKNSPFTCYGIHAAEALLGDPSVSDGDKRKYVDEIFSIIFNKYLVVKTFSSSDDPRILSNNILVLGHSLEIYLEYKKYFSPEQQEVFKFMIAELAELMKSVSLSKKHTASYDAFLIHLVGVLRRLEE